MDNRFVRRIRFAACAAAASLALCASCAPPSDYSLTFSFNGPRVSPNTVYAVWIEDETGKILQNVYVCSKEASQVGLIRQLTGDALPNWLTKKYPQHKDINGITGASVQEALSVSRGLSIGSVRKFRVCFEIDRSQNGNSYFTDRPAFTYASGLIDLDDLRPSYQLTFSGWMSNATGGTPYGQQPLSVIPGFAQYAFMTDPAYIKDGSGSLDDMVSSAQATVTKN